MIDIKSVGKNIKKFRREKGYTQAEIAEMIDVSTIHMSHIETGYVSMSLECLVKICDALKITPDSLLLSGYEINEASAVKQLSTIMNNLTDSEKKLVIDFADLLEKSKINRS